MGKLTAVAVRASKAVAGKRKKLSDGGGLYLLVTPKGSRYWRYDYRLGGARKTLSLGTYPEVELKEARLAHAKARADLSKNLDPSQLKQLNKHALLNAAQKTFEVVALDWFERRLADKSASYRVRTLRILEKDLLPFLKHRPISEISAPELLVVLRRIENRTVDIAHRAKQTCGQIFRYAIASGLADRDVSADLHGALKAHKKVHRAALIDPRDVARLLVGIDCYRGSAVVRTALSLSALLFQRPGEIRKMEWQEIRWDLRRWEIPAEKMKMRREHIVPLSRQAVAELRFTQRLTGNGVYVFPSPRQANRPLSDNAVRTALRSIGFTNDEMCPHGFRAMARTLLDEVLDVRVDFIEHQLAHAVRDATGRAYNRTAFLEQRTDMMEKWAVYLNELRKRPTEGEYHG